MKRIYCFRCKKEINKKDNYYEMVEMNNGKEVKTNYVHRICWDSFLNQFNSASQTLNQSKFLLNAMGKQMMKMGIIEEPKVEIKC